MKRWGWLALVGAFLMSRVEAQEKGKACEKAKSAKEHRELQAKRGAEAKKAKAGGQTREQAQKKCGEMVHTIHEKIEVTIKLEVTIEEKTQGNDKQHAKCAAAKETCDKLEKEYKEFAEWCEALDQALAEVEKFEKEIKELDALVDDLEAVADALYELGLHEEADEFEEAAEALEDLLSDLVLEWAVYHYACGEDEVGDAIVVWWVEANLDDFDD